MTANERLLESNKRALRKVSKDRLVTLIRGDLKVDVNKEGYNDAKLDS
jgi:hypothetical protein